MCGACERVGVEGRLARSLELNMNCLPVVAAKKENG